MVPNEIFVEVGSGKIEGLDWLIYHLRDTKESLPCDGATQELFDQALVLAQFVRSHLRHGSLFIHACF
jgi:hypothetical protein